MKTVIKKIATRYTFAYYDYDDIYQESMILCLGALHKYDGRVPLVNFLSRHLSNRLKSLRRDKFYRPFKCKECKDGTCESCQKRIEKRNSKKNILACIDVTSVKDENEKNMRFTEDIALDLDIQEMQDLIDQCLPAEYREDYLKYKAGVPMPTPKKKQIETIILSIIL